MSIEVEIQKTAYGGEGITHIDGKVCFVSGALPGERVLVEVTEDKKKFYRAKTLKILEPSVTRVEPPCPYVNECGGCQYQHVSYEEELRWKTIQVRELFQRTLGTAAEKILPAVASPKLYRYRNDVTLHETVKNSPQAQLFGFVSGDNHTVIPVEDCLLVNEHFKDIFNVKYLLKKGEKRITFRLSEHHAVHSDRKDQLFGVQIDGQSLVTSTKGFFQNNLEVTALMTRQVRSWLEEIKPGVFIDLYAGVGTFSILSAQDVPQVVCVEENPYSLEAMRQNFKDKKREALIFPGKVERVFIQKFKKNPFPGSLVFADPPRKGMMRECSEFIADREEIRDFIYLSCHQGTLTRDLEWILKRSRFEICQVVPFDLFPRTKHIEILVRLSRV